MLNKLPTVMLIFIFLLPLLGVSQSQQTDYFPNRLIIKYESDQKLQQIQSKIGTNPKVAVQQLLNRYGAQISRPLLSSKTQQLVKAQRLPAANDVLRIKEVVFSHQIDPAQLASKINRMPGVAYAEPKYLRYMSAKPNDPDIQKFVEAHNFTGAWDISQGSKDIIVAVVDGGVGYTHTELNENLWINQEEIPPTVFTQADENGDGEVTAS